MGTQTEVSYGTHIDADGEASDAFNLEHRCGCWIVRSLPSRSGVPLTEVTRAVLALTGKNSLMSLSLATILDAIMVAGSQKQLDQLAKHPSTLHKGRDMASRLLRGAAIQPSPELFDWVAEARMGVSSAYLIGTLLQAPNLAAFGPGGRRDTVPIPSDDGDIARCVDGLSCQPGLIPLLDGFFEDHPDWQRFSDKLRLAGTRPDRRPVGLPAAPG